MPASKVLLSAEKEDFMRLLYTILLLIMSILE